MGFTVYYRSTRPIAAPVAAALERSTDELSRGRTWLSCEPVHFFPESKDGHLLGGSKPNFQPHPDDVASAAREGLPDGTTLDMLDVLCQLSRNHGIDWEISHDHSDGPVGYIRSGVCDKDVVSQVEAFADVGDILRAGNDGEGAFTPSAPLHRAAAKNDVAVIEQLIAAGRDIDEIPRGYTVTALAVAASEGTPATIRKLVELGADLQNKGHDGATPLRFAVQSSQGQNIRTLVELGAEIDEYDPTVGTLLHVAVLQSSADVVRLLMELGLDPKRKNHRGITPLDGAQAQLRGLHQAESMMRGASVPAIADHIRELEELERIMTAKP